MPTTDCEQMALKFERSGIHYASLATSGRLQRLLVYLTGKDWVSTMDIVSGAGICAVNSAVSELRRNGIRVDCQMMHYSETGARVYKYRLAEI